MYRALWLLSVCVQSMWIGIEFTSPGPNWAYTIRMNSTSTPPTNVATDPLQVWSLRRMRV